MRFELKNYVDKYGLSQIRLVKQSGQKKKRISTNLKIEPKYFQNKHNSWIKRGHPDSNRMNTKLAEIYKSYREVDFTTSTILVKEGIDLYLQAVRESNDHAPATKDKIATSFRGLKIFLESEKLYNKPIMSLKNADMKKYFKQGVDSGKKESTMNHKVKDFKACLSYLAQELEIIPDNPLRNLRFKNIKQAPKKVPTIDEILELRDYVPRSESEELAKDLWWFAVFCKGIRMIDIYHLKKENLDRAGGQIIVQTKKNGVLVTVPLIQPILDIVDKYENDTDYIFDFKRKPGHRDVGTVGSRIASSLKRICKNSNIERIQGVHTARHVFGMLASRSNAGNSEISMALGHSSTRVTDTYLGRHNPNPQLDLLENTLSIVGLSVNTRYQ